MGAPVHHVGESYLEHFNRAEAPYHEDDAMLQVVRLLKNAAPQSLNLEDDAGRNAVEYAINSNANLGVIRTMQRACRDDWKERSKITDAIEGDAGATSGWKPRLGRRKHQDLLHELQQVRLAKVHRTPLDPTIMRTARMA